MGMQAVRDEPPTGLEVADLIGRRIVDSFDLNYPAYGLVLDDGRCVVFGMWDANCLRLWEESDPPVRPC